MNKAQLIALALKCIRGSGLPKLWESLSASKGAILCFHHVLPNGGKQLGFSPNHQLEISPEFLEEIVLHLKSKNYRFIAIDDVAAEFTDKSKQPFVVFTFDDGYRDNARYAAPILRKHGVPYTIYVTQRIADGTCELWWRALETLILQNSHLELTLNRTLQVFDTSSDEKKTICANKLFAIVKAMDEKVQRKWIRETCERYNINIDQICRESAMSWDELRIMAQDPLCTIGAHTINHFAVRKLSRADAEQEIIESQKAVENALNRSVKHFAFPYGDHAAAGPRDFSIARDAGFFTAVTTRKGLVFQEHQHLLNALPRLMISGRYQSIAMFDTLLSGLPFALLNNFRKVDAN